MDFGSIKNVGTTPVNNIVLERKENGKYLSFTEFCERISEKAVNKKCIESLIKAGAFDDFGMTRSTLLASFETIVDAISNENKRGIDGQVTMFDISSEETKEEINKMKYKFEMHDEMTKRELLSIEKEMLGIYISGHPLEKYKKQILRQTNISSNDIEKILEESKELDIEILENSNETFNNIYSAKKTNQSKMFSDGQNVKYAGIINIINKKYTKNNKLMAFITIEDLYGQLEVMTFENVLLRR